MAAPVNGIFNNAAFGLESLTDSILQIPYCSTAARSLPIWTNEGIATTTIDLEYDSINMALIPTSQRGGPATQYRANKRTVRSLKVPHLQLDDVIAPESIQNVRLFGSNNQLASAISVVKKSMDGMVLSHDATLEYQSIGALKGVIYDADGSTLLYNLFSEFQVTQTVIDFLLGDANQDMKHACLKVKRAIEKALQVGNTLLDIFCFAGNDWFDAFVAHPTVAKAYERWQDAGGQFGAFARDDKRGGFTYAGITFFNYTSSVVGSGGTAIDFIPAGTAQFFPVGVPGLFKTVFAPANMMETVNTIGLPRYARGEPLDFGRGLKVLTESNPLAYCTRPAALVKATSTSWPTGIP